MKQYPAIALIEFSGIPAGMFAGDIMLKQAPVSVLRSGTVHNGKYLFMVGGSVASVTESFHKGIEIGAGNVIDSILLPDIHPQVHDAILGDRRKINHDALGILESSTVAAGIAGADAAVKATGVDLVELRLADDLGGKSLVIVNGSIDEIQVAVQVLRDISNSHSGWLQDAVIPRIDTDLSQQIEGSTRFSAASLKKLASGEM